MKLDVRKHTADTRRIVLWHNTVRLDEVSCCQAVMLLSAVMSLTACHVACQAIDVVAMLSCCCQVGRL